MYSFQAKVDGIRLLEDNKNIFTFFKYVGMYLIKHDGRQFRVSFGLLFLSKVLWMLWHLIGTALAVWVWQLNRKSGLRNRAMSAISTTMSTTMRTTVSTTMSTNHTNGILDEVSDEDDDDDDDEENIGFQHHRMLPNTDNDDNVDHYDHDDEGLSGVTLFLDVCVVLMCYLIVGPIQSSILKYTMEAFPTILQLVKKIEDLDFHSLVKTRYKRIRASKIILRSRDEFETQQLRDQLAEMDQQPEVLTERRISNISTMSDIGNFMEMTEKRRLGRTFSTNSVVNKVVKKGYDVIPKMWAAIILILGIIAIGIVAYNAFITDDFDLLYEAKLVLMCFYLVFPVITTWFCIVLIEHHRNMYKILVRLKDEAFRSREDNMLKDITTYINTLQRLFQKLSENILEFTLGINFAIFTIISTASTYQILQNLHIMNGAGSETHFVDIVYVFPLAISLSHIYVVCKRTHDLKNRAYDHLRIRLKEMLPELLMEGEEKLFKKVEILYKNLKDWPPQVCIYGGFRVNHRILAAILFFSFAYARTFNRINRGMEKKCNCSDGHNE